jgi:hypothetical protein
MPKLHSLAATVAASAVLATAGPAVAAPVTVNLRVEGSTQTLFEGPVTTDAKTLTKDGSGPHPCDGTNGGANPTPGPTMTGAMDDGITAAGLTWKGTWNSGFADFSIDGIGPDNVPPSFDPYWGYFLNNVASQVGGCQAQVKQGDDVLFAFASFGEKLLLLSAPAKAATNESFPVTVQDDDGNGTRGPAAGATVGGATTDSAGHATLSFADPGNHRLKAERSGSIRSNAATVCVYVPGSGDCGTERSADTPPSTTPTETPAPAPTPAVKDTTAPVVHVSSISPNKTYARGPRVLSGSVDESGGIAQVFMRLRATDGGNLTAASRCHWFSGKRGVFTHRTVACARARFFRVGTNAKFSYLLPSRLGRGRYVLDVKVLDRASNAGRSSVPFRVR